MNKSLLFPLYGKCHRASSLVLYILIISECSLMPWFAGMARERRVTPPTQLQGAGSAELHPEVMEAGSVSQTIPIWPAQHFCTQEQRGALIICQA